MSQPCDILIYVQHLLGIGHMRRAAVLARAAQARGLTVSVVSGGMANARADFGAARVHHLPPLRTADATFTRYLDESGAVADDAYWRSRAEQLHAIDMAEQPAMILTEHFPFGRRRFRHEIIPILKACRARGGTTVSSVRDVLVDTGNVPKAQDMVGLARDHFDAVLVHGDPAVISFDETFPPASALADKLIYTGYVVDDRDAADNPAATSSDDAANPDGTDEIIVSAGGGAAGMPLLACALNVALTQRGERHRWRVLCGHALPAPSFERLQNLAADAAHIVVERARPDFHALLRRSRLSISQAGYNTVMDVVTTGARALLVPFSQDGESEQMYRAQAFAGRGLVALLDENEMTLDTLADSVERALTLEPVGPEALAIDGASRSGDTLLALRRGTAISR
ncbi:MAG: glycosyltransferase [Pseudomonadota bacterium]